MKEVEYVFLYMPTLHSAGRSAGNAIYSSKQVGRKLMCLHCRIVGCDPWFKSPPNLRKSTTAMHEQNAGRMEGCIWYGI
jgi:hypothetical protein